MKEVGEIVESAEVEVNETSMSNADFFANAFVDFENQQAIQNGETQTPAEKRAETISQLEAHYGSTVLHYHSRSGTVTEIINLCPASEFFLNQGFEAFVDWIDEYQTEPEVEDDTQKVVQEDEPLVDSQEKIVEDVKKSEEPAKAKGEVKSDEKAAEKAEMQGQSELDVKAPEVVLAVDKPEVVKSSTKPVVDEAGIKPKVITAQPKVQAANADIEVNKAVLEEAIVPEVEVITDEEKIVALEVTQESLLKLTTEEQSELETEIATEPNSEVANEYTQESENLVLEELIAHNKFEARDDVEVEEAEEVPGAPSHSEEVSIQFEEWNEIAKDEPPLDELFITIAEQLDTLSLYDEFEQEEITGDDLIEHDLESETISSEEESFNLEDSAEIENQNFKEASPELFAVFLTVQSSKKAVESLYQAKTKEECAFYINEIIVELSQILRALGYDNPEKVVRDFLQSHSPEALKSLVIELEKSLRNAMGREVRRKLAHHVKSRQTRLSKFIGFIMAVATSRNIVASTAN